jgi:hypothetical protein
MPAQQRLRSHQENVPATARQPSAQRSNEKPIMWLEPRLANLPSKDRQLVAEDENSSFACSRRPSSTTSSSERQKTTYKEDTGKGDLQQTGTPTLAPPHQPLCAHPIRFLHPTRRFRRPSSVFVSSARCQERLARLLRAPWSRSLPSRRFLHGLWRRVSVTHGRDGGRARSLTGARRRLRRRTRGGRERAGGRCGGRSDVGGRVRVVLVERLVLEQRPGERVEAVAVVA